MKVEASSGTGDLCGAADGDGDCREQWVAIVGGGYEEVADPNHKFFVDDTSHTAWSARSRSMFMIALDTGDVLAKVVYDESGVNGPDDMLYSLAASPALVATAL